MIYSGGSMTHHIVVLAEHGGAFSPDFLARVGWALPANGPISVDEVELKRVMDADPVLEALFYAGPWTLIPAGPDLQLTTLGTDEMWDAAERVFDCGIAVHPEEFWNNSDGTYFVYVEWTVPITATHNSANARWVRLDSLDETELAEYHRQLILRTWEGLADTAIPPSASSHFIEPAKRDMRTAAQRRAARRHPR